MKKHLFFIMAFIFGGTGFVNTAYSQWFSSSVMDCYSQKWMLSVGGQYSELDWQQQAIHTFDRQVQAQLGVSFLPWMGLIGTVGYGNFDFRRNETEEIHFDLDYHWGGTLHVGPFYFLPKKFAFSVVFTGTWFNPYGKEQKSLFIEQSEWQQVNEYILESLKGGMALNFVFRTKIFDFYAGPQFFKQEYHLKSRRLFQGNDFSGILETASASYNTDIVKGVILGAGVKLPGRYYLNIEVRNDDLNQVFGVVSIAQVGNP
jgi:hypothetical protein